MRMSGFFAAALAAASLATIAGPALAQSNFSTPAANTAERPAQTHWAPYRANWTTPPSVDQHLEDPILDRKSVV